MKFGSLFAGIGGLDLGLERAGMQCEWQVEIDEYCRRVLEKHWPDVPKFRDVRQCGWINLSPVDLICGGFPCQDVSHAGPRIGIKGKRSGLWAEFARIIGELRPRVVLVENVPGLLDRGIDTVLGDLASLGFDAEWSYISACAVGAPHTRERLFVVAYSQSQRSGQLRWIERPQESQTKRNLYWTQSEPGCERVANGVPNRVDRLKGLGNAVVPQCAQIIGELIIKLEEESEDAKT